MNLALVNPRVWLEIAIAAAVIALAWWAYNAVYDRGAQSVQTEWDADKLAQANASAQALADKDAVQAALQTNADKLRKSKNAQIQKLNADLATALASLHSRPPRPDPESVSGDTATGPATGCTGAQLYRPDAGFLTRESARGNRILADLAECQAAHGAARQALK